MGSKTIPSLVVNPFIQSCFWQVAAASGYIGIFFGQILGGQVGTMLHVYGRLVRMGQPGLNETFSKQPEAIL